MLPCVLFVRLSHVLKDAFGKFIFIQFIQILFKFYMIILKTFFYKYIFNINLVYHFQTGKCNVIILAMVHLLLCLQLNMNYFLSIMDIMFMKKRKSFEIFGVKILRTTLNFFIRNGFNLIKRLTIRRFTSCHSNDQL
jgi:hypothetical protein